MIESMDFRTDWLAADGVNKNWSYEFTLLSQSHVIVQVRSAAGVITEFTSNLTLFPTDDTEGYVRYPVSGSALAAGNHVRIVRDVPYTQPLALGDEGAFHATLHEKAFDTLEMQIQQLHDIGYRALTVEIGEVGPIVTVGAEDETLVFDADGNLVPGMTAEQIAAMASQIAGEIGVGGVFDTLATGGSLAAPVGLDLRQRPRPLTQFGSGLVLTYDDTGLTTGATANTAIVQAALDSGEPEIVIPRWIAIDAPVIHKYDQRIRGLGGYRTGLVGVGFGGAGNLLKVQPAIFGLPYKRADKRQWGWENFGFRMHSGQCSIPMLIDTTLGGTEASVFLNKPRMFGLVFEQGIGAALRSFRHDNTAGHYTGGMFGALIEQCWFGDGIDLLNTGDSNNIVFCIISGAGIGVNITPIAGAAKNIIGFCNITAAGGAVYVGGGIQTGVLFNQTEQDQVYSGAVAVNYGGTNYGAGIFVAATASDTVVEGNNANGYNKVIPIYDQGTNTVIDKNTLESSVLLVPHIRCDGSGWDVRKTFSSAAVRYGFTSPALGDIKELSGTFSAGLSGVSGVVSGNIAYRREGKTVTLSIPSITGTSNTTAATLTGMPENIRPTGIKTNLAPVIDNGVTAAGLLQVAANGTISLYKDPGGGAFTASGAKGIAPCEITYTI